MSFFAWSWLPLPASTNLSSPLTPDSNNCERLIYITNYYQRAETGTGSATIYLCSTTPQDTHRFLPISPATSPATPSLTLSPPSTAFSSGFINVSHPIGANLVLAQAREISAIPLSDPIDIFAEAIRLDAESQMRFFQAVADYRENRIERYVRAKELATSTTAPAPGAPLDDDEKDVVINSILSDSGVSTPSTDIIGVSGKPMNEPTWVDVVKKAERKIDVTGDPRYWIPSDNIWEDLRERERRGLTTPQPFGVESDRPIPRNPGLPEIIFRPCRFSEFTSAEEPLRTTTERT